MAVLLLALGGCAVTPPPAPTPDVEPPEPTPSATATPTPTPEPPQDGVFPTRIFADDSPFYQTLPDDTPVAEYSDELISGVVRMTQEYYGSPSNPTVDMNYHRYALPMYLATNDDPIAEFTGYNCQDKSDGWDDTLIGTHLADVHIPADAVPDDSTDRSMVIYNVDTDRLTETWVTAKEDDGTWSACWGGSIEDASTSLGQFDRPYGVAAAGVSYAAFQIRPEELQRGYIDHVIGIALPEVKADVYSWPANRTDGTVHGLAIAEGQLLRLPADLNLDDYNLSPLARTIARAAQEYGIMVVDVAGSVTFMAQHEISAAPGAYDDLFRDSSPRSELAGQEGEDPFPIDQLEVLPRDYRAPGTREDD
ncbi:hypothetical protein PCC79_09395 [Propioniciclava soli]|uniref:Uncharacterized protein n=1 Tax=Propioniciclava soli TaxID=2775081 RepID=A0ABZ3C2L8_9ACTN